MPPLLDLAVTGGSRVRSRIRSRIGIGSGVVATTIGVADDDNSVIELFTAISVLLNDTTLVKLEGCSAGIEGNGQRLLSDLSLDL